MNWPLIIRQLCEAYLGTTPADYEDLTHDQLAILYAPKALLASSGGMATMTIDEARQIGLKQPSAARPGGPQSLVQRIRQEKKDREEKTKRADKRERRRKWEADLKERRARGEKI